MVSFLCAFSHQSLLPFSQESNEWDPHQKSWVKTARFFEDNSKYFRRYSMKQLVKVIHVLRYFSDVWNEQDYHNHYAHHIKIEKKEWKTEFKIRALVKKVDVFTKRKVHMTNSIFTSNHSHSESFDRAYNVSM